jgi:hypothetical protein
MEKWSFVPAEGVLVQANRRVFGAHAALRFLADRVDPSTIPRLASTEP